MALNAGLASMTDAMKLAAPSASSFERLALPVAVRKQMGVIAMKVFGQEHLVGAAPAEKLLAYAWSLPISLASVGMPQLDFVARNAVLARAFAPMSAAERSRLAESIAEGRKHAMLRFLRDHADV